ncbi:MAG: IclR family transcriptional regulator [Acidimicrobiales bacterium]
MEQTVTGVGVLDKTASLLDAVEAGPRSLADLVAHTGLARATVHRLATAMEAHRLLARDADGRYIPGARFTGRSLVEAAQSALLALRDATEESVQLYVRRGDRRVCVGALESPHGLRTIVAVGAALPMDAGSAAAVLRADRAVLKRGWAESVEERERGVASVSAPVFDGGRVIAAVSVSGPVERTSRQPGERYAAAVVRAARSVEAVLTG